MWLHQRRGWRRGSATGLLLVGILLLFVVLGVGMGAVLADQVDEAAGQLPVWIDKLNAFTEAHFDITVVSSAGAAESGEATQQVTEYLQEHAGDLLGAVGSLLGGIFSLFTVGLFTFYFTANLYSRGLLALINGGLMFLTLKLLGVPYALAWRCSSGWWPRSSPSLAPTSRGQPRCWWPWPRSAPRRR